jgi:hypothetical protein
MPLRIVCGLGAYAEFAFAMLPISFGEGATHPNMRMSLRRINRHPVDSRAGRAPAIRQKRSNASRTANSVRAWLLSLLNVIPSILYHKYLY